VGDPYIDDVVLLVHFDGVDAATATTDVKGHALTFAGNAQLDTAEKKFGTASYLGDGTGDYLSTPDSDDWYLPGEFTIEAWVKPNFSGIKTGYIIAHGTFVNPNFDWALRYTYTNATTKRFVFEFYPTGSSASVKSADTGGLDIDQGVFHHVAAVRNASNEFRIYLDGVDVTVGVQSDASTTNTTGSLHIGTLIAGSQSYVGWIDEVRITKGVCRYTGNFTPPTEAFSDT
jgi:hypothetical protein